MVVVVVVEERRLRLQEALDAAPVVEPVDHVVRVRDDLVEGDALAHARLAERLEGRQGLTDLVDGLAFERDFLREEEEAAVADAPLDEAPAGAGGVFFDAGVVDGLLGDLGVEGFEALGDSFEEGDQEGGDFE